MHTDTVIEHTLQLLNDDPSQVYAFAYDPIMKAYKVYKLIEVKHEANREQCWFRLVPNAVSHRDLASALKDGILLKGHLYTGD